MIKFDYNLCIITLLTQLYALLCVLFNTVKINNGIVEHNKCKTVEHWAQESDKGLANVKFV